MITVELVLAIHQTILENEPGLKGVADIGRLDSALARIDNWMLYENTDNIFDIAALYAVAIAKAHAFPDSNKRTAMVTMLTYLDLQGIEIPPNHGLDDTMVDVASGKLNFLQLSQHLQQLIEK
ncbi:type II toxin-antitoxin system death-on-curing family toxin [Pasteurella multocida]|uniref:type II toxin-antitoxin system death-on-curing family toxin n=1 Tax=Pasteurella multocida TaxID=747 RepID=UPI001879C6D8|nr:type II toxin-antitoxin system death-on-curing family toxin [Pasteurella multocida]MBE7395154.1 type II toxin-antitoxin system death-on-curing family toxin [Pasteurella multocida]